jgi:Protein of unknown function (DUF2723)
MPRTTGAAAAEDRSMPRADLAIALALAAVTVLSRIPFRARLLPTWDAVQFALALDRYDIAAHQPHPPGYILYVAAAHVVRLAIGDATQSLVWLSIAASGVAVFLVHRLAWMLYGRLAAGVAAIGFATSPLFWFYGEVGLPYAVEAALACFVATLTWSARAGEARAAVWSAVALGLAGGVRQSLLLLLFPMWAATVWAGARRVAPLIAGGVAMAAVTLLWLVPMLVLAGGPAAYLGASRELFDSTVRPTTVMAPSGAWIWNALALGEAALLGLGLLLPVLVWALARAIRRGWSRRESFLVIWILPPLGVYTWLHFGQYGYLLAVLPALYILIAAALAEALGAPSASRPSRAIGTAALAGVLIAHVAFVTGSPSIHVPDVPEGASWALRQSIGLEARYRYRLWPHTLRGLREGEEVIRSYAAAVRRDFSPADTVIVSELGNPRSYPWFRHLTYYLPEFRVCHLRLPPWSTGYLDSADLASMTARPEERIAVDPRVRHLVWVVDSWSPHVARPEGLRELPVPYGRKLYALDLDGRPVAHAGYRFTTGPGRGRAVARGEEDREPPAQAGTDLRGVR